MAKEYDIKDRTFKFAQRVLEIVAMLPRAVECDVIRKQLTEAGTSVGANVEEADGALSKKDFINKMGIARREAKESRYWLRLISGKYIDKEKIARDIQEANEIKNILSSIIENTKKTK
ncbi:MAG: four helix bundle protein [Candidatus Omnitrophota bacterium]